MRYVTYVITPRRGYFDAGEEVMRANDVTPEAILDTDVLTDETIIQRLSVDGTLSDIHACFDTETSTVHSYQVIEADGKKVVQVHYTPSDMLWELYTAYQNRAVLMDFPMEYVGLERRSLRVSQAGPIEEIRKLVEETRVIVDVEIEQLRSYDPSAGRLFADLTARQREVLETAVTEGYYAVPREVTYEDVAEQLDCSAGAVGQHLRRIEAQLMGSIVTGGEVLEETEAVVDQ